MSYKTVMVTGGAGFIGTHVVLALLKPDYRVVVRDDLSTGHAELIPATVILSSAMQATAGWLARR